MEKLKLSAEIAAELRSRVRTLDLETSEKIRKAGSTNGTFDVIISTESLDRAGEIVKQDGWDLSNYKNNPVVLWGHDYYSLPIGICTETYNTTYRGQPALGARGVFYPEEINPLAQQVRRMYDYGSKMGVGVGATTSVGFIPKEFDPQNQNVITRAELLEFSFVPIPAQQDVGPAQGRMLTFEEATQLGLDLATLKTKGIEFATTKGYVPNNVSEKKAEEDTPWSKPGLGDFTDKAWDELSATEKTHIAGHYAYSENKPPETFGDLKLPHHRAEDGAVVWNGVRAAMGALMGARGGVEVDGERRAVYDHLVAHYRQFEKDPPEFKTLKEAQAGDKCTMDDGTPGILATDPNDTGGALVCVPEDQDKSKKGQTDSGDEPTEESMKSLTKAINEEHNRHEAEVEDAIKAFQKAVIEDQPDENDDDDKKKAHKENSVKKHLKALRGDLEDAHDEHKTKSIAIFRSFTPKEEKAFDKREHIKALREEHKAYDEKAFKSLDEFEKKTVAGDMHDNDEDEGNEHTDWITKELAMHRSEHKESVQKLAIAMCKAGGFGDEGEDVEERAIADLIIRTAEEVGFSGITEEVALKIGAKLSAHTKEQLKEAHDHLMKGVEIIKALHGGLGEQEPDEDVDDGHGAPEDKELKKHLITRDLARQLSGALNDYLSGSRKIVRETIRNH